MFVVAVFCVGVDFRWWFAGRVLWLVWCCIVRSLLLRFWIVAADWFDCGGGFVGCRGYYCSLLSWVLLLVVFDLIGFVVGGFLFVGFVFVVYVACSMC